MSLVLNSGFSIGPGVVLDANPTIIPPIVETNLVLHLDAGNPSSYPGSGSTWTDLVASKQFTLYGGPTYSGNNGGYLEFDPNNSQYADATSLPSTLSTWTLEAWFYNNGNYLGQSPCIITDVYNGNPINFTLGNTFDGYPVLQTGFFDGSWHATSGSYTLPSTGWFHIAGTWDGTDMKMYVNNSLVSTTTPGGTSTSGGQGIRLMRRWDAPDYMGGRLGSIRIYDTTLDFAGVTQNFNADRARFGL